MHLAQARLARLRTDDGLVEIVEGVPVGTLYVIDLHQKQPLAAYNTEKKRHHSREWVRGRRADTPDAPLQWLCYELLEVL